eukprot:CAMPEP_0202038366 /NCGR_PEP_ID=MMETSP0962-20130828/8981_1 /ASSEMBLY_ACC=CAM_ASM_000488 /TAXON_ID=4773 /ORGANISM="Schizochytrium aggregatum, Strain ATCC28209" /LENGTH=262 /DNA_ID=CAMNT_0048602519 /DNA_START=52 /DNA_END=840 /DNA_ORIENTATION=+
MSDAANVAELEAGVKNLEVEVAEKDAAIEKLSGGEAPAAPEMPGTPPEEAKELLVYDDDVALGKDAPSLAPLKFFNGPAFDIKEKVTVVTFSCNLNKSDFVTLSVLSDVYQEFKDQANFVSISRDHEEADVEKWLKKYNGTFMAEQKGPNGEAGITSRCDFQMAYDPEHKVNAEFKTALGKSVVGVGMVVIIDKAGKIAWYETFVRGANPAGQFKYQLWATINEQPLVKNGPAPEIEEEEVEGDTGDIPDDVDFLAGGGGNY